jgi:hypothetical protein
MEVKMGGAFCLMSYIQVDRNYRNQKQGLDIPEKLNTMTPAQKIDRR